MYSYNNEQMQVVAAHMRRLYPAGTRIVLQHMPKDPNPVPDNSYGTVLHVDDTGTVFCEFDNGRRIGLLPGVDIFRKIEA